MLLSARAIEMKDSYTICVCIIPLVIFYFITTFNFDVDDFLKNHQEFLQKEYENLKHLIEKRK